MVKLEGREMDGGTQQFCIIGQRPLSRRDQTRGPGIHAAAAAAPRIRGGGCLGIVGLDHRGELPCSFADLSLLSEHVGVQRALVIAAGFAGTIIIIRPGAVEFGTGPFIVLAAAFLYSCAYIVTKKLAGTDSGNQVVFYMSLFILIFSAIPATFVWRTPELVDAAPLIAMGLTGYTTHYCLTRSMAVADASFVVPFDFFRLPLSVGFGYILFAEPLDPFTWLGAAVIFAGAYYNTLRESKLGLNPRR